MDGDSKRRGFVTDLSASGLFLQTTATVEPGTKLVIRLEADVEPPLVLTGSVARTRRSHRGVTAVESHPGVGFELHSAPEAYFQLVMDTMGRR